MQNLKGKRLLFISLSLIFFTFLVSNVSAEDIKVVRQNTADTLIRGCWNNGTFCSPSAVCRSTITNPNGILILINKTEVNEGTYFSLNLTSNTTGTLGTYEVIRTCTDTGGDISGNAADSYQYVVTPSGTDDNSLAQIILLSFGFLFSVGIIAMGFSSEDYPLLIFGSLGLVVFGLFTLLNGVGNYRNDLTFGASLLILGLGGYISIRSAVEMIDA